MIYTEFLFHRVPIHGVIISMECWWLSSVRGTPIPMFLVNTSGVLEIG